MVLVLVTATTRISIGRNFVDFLHQQERGRAGQLVEELVTWYGNQGNWDGLADNPRSFYDLIFIAWPQGSQIALQKSPQSRLERGKNLGTGERSAPPRAREGRRGPGPGSGPPSGMHGGPREALHQRIFLLDADKNLVIGQVPPEFDDNNLLPIEVNGARVGWLGVGMVLSVVLPEEEAFLEHQRSSLLLGLGTGLVVAALLAWLLARHLAAHPRQVFSRDQLISAIYNDYRIVSDRTVDTHVKNLRGKLSAANPGPELIESVYGIGYRLVT